MLRGPRRVFVAVVVLRGLYSAVVVFVLGYRGDVDAFDPLEYRNAIGLAFFVSTALQMVFILAVILCGAYGNHRMQRRITDKRLSKLLRRACVCGAVTGPLILLLYVFVVIGYFNESRETSLDEPVPQVGVLMFTEPEKAPPTLSSYIAGSPAQTATLGAAEI